jgi:HSP20 family protein
MAKAKESREEIRQEQPRGQQTSTPGAQSNLSSGTPTGPSSGRARRESYLTNRGAGSSSFSPFSVMNRFADEMERIFGGFGFGHGPLTPRGWGMGGQFDWSPQIEVHERDGQFIVRADLPGLSTDDVKVDINDDALTIRGERKQEHEENREGFYRSERSYGSFFRSIPLPEGVNAEEAKASFRDGVLEITMPAPQRTERRGRQIEIKG